MNMIPIVNIIDISETERTEFSPPVEIGTGENKLLVFVWSHKTLRYVGTMPVTEVMVIPLDVTAEDAYHILRLVMKVRGPMVAMETVRARFPTTKELDTVTAWYRTWEQQQAAAK